MIVLQIAVPNLLLKYHIIKVKMAYKVLLIEDNDDMRDNIAEILMLSGYEVEQANNGKDGVKLAIQTIPDIIVCDVMMPIMDGFETLYILEKNDKTKHIPFIFLTAKTAKQDIRTGMNLGADDFLTKPFEEMDLLKAIETRLIKYELQQHKKQEHSKIEITDSNVAQEIQKLPGAKLQHIKKKEVLFYEKDDANTVYLIIEGKIRLFKEHIFGKEFTTQVLKVNQCLGFASVFNNRKHDHTATCIEDGKVLLVDKEVFMDFINSTSSVSNYFLKLLSSQSNKQEEHMMNLAYNSVRKRVADCLLLLETKFNPEELKNQHINIPRDELASMVGTSAESVIRVLSDFKSNGIIKVQSSEITIKDINELRTIKN